MSKADRKAYAKQKQQELRDEIARNEIREQLELIGPFRRFLIRSGAPESLRNALDDWTEELTGDRQYFWTGHMNSPKPRILLKHERR